VSTRVLCLGVSHRTASIELLGRLAARPPALAERLAAAAAGRAGDGGWPREVVVLSTCNRHEVYAVDGDGPADRALATLAGWCAVRLGLELPAAARYALVGGDASRHLARVASGLDSMVLGESEILGQLGAAHRAAAAHGLAGPVLGALFRTAVAAGRRARAETAIGRAAASFATAAVDAASEAVGGLGGRRVVVIGAGRMGRKIVAAVRARSSAGIVVLNRTVSAAEALAGRHGAHALGLEALPCAVGAADVLFACAAVERPIVNAAAIGARIDSPRGALVVVDLGVPPNVDEGVEASPGARVVGLEQLGARVSAALGARAASADRAEMVALEEMRRFEEWCVRRATWTARARSD
jgi:glutamyl-tRNA reductase